MVQKMENNIKKKKGKQKRELNHQTKEAVKRGKKSNKRIEHKINWI